MVKKGKSRGNRSYSSHWGSDSANITTAWNTEGDFVPAWLTLDQIRPDDLPINTNLPGNESQRYLPFYINNDATRDGADAIVLAIDEGVGSVGFSQETYILKEAWDQPSGDVSEFGFSNTVGPPIYQRQLPDPSELSRMFLVNETSQPLNAPKLIKGGRFTEAIVIIEDAQSSSPPIRLGNTDDIYTANILYATPSQNSEYFNFAEFDVNAWQAFAADGALTRLSNDTSLVKEGQASIKFETQSGFDTGVKITAPADIYWDVSGDNIFTFWIYAINNNAFGFQGNQPVVVLNSPNGSFRYEPRNNLMVTQQWQQIKVPLVGSQDWNRTTTGTPSFNNITSIEIHQDTWDYGFTAYYDGLKFTDDFDIPRLNESAPSPTVIYAGSGDDQITVNRHRSQLFGEAGNDRLRGSGFLYGGSGDDRLSGDGILDGMMGDDVIEGDGILTGGSGNDAIFGGSQADQLFGGDGNDYLSAGLKISAAGGNNPPQYVIGGAGSDRFDFYSLQSTPPSFGSLQDDFFAGYVSSTIEDFDATEGDKIGIYVGSSANSSFTNAGLSVNTTITAEQFHVGSEASDANDRFIYSRGSNKNVLYFDADGTGNIPRFSFAVFPSTVTLTYQDIVTFDDSNRFPQPSSNRSPKSTPEATDQDDLLTGTTQPDQITGLNGDDLIRGGGGRDKIRGGKGNDKLSGGDGNDILNGGAGQDWLYGDRGQDKLTGGQDKDLFVLQKVGRDTVLDFQDRRDRLGLLPGMKFKQLKFGAEGQDTLISMNSRPLALLKGIAPGQLTRADFSAASPFETLL
jgi:Ca2+-binding RTX toxin-like protein